MNIEYGPTLEISKEIHRDKYRAPGETFTEAMTRVAQALGDNQEHTQQFLQLLLEMKFMPAGRVQAAMGATRRVTPYNCFVSMTIEDSMESIGKATLEAAETMRLGGGIGYDFSNLRPEGAMIRSLGSKSSGPVSFMQVFNAWCGTIASAGHRRGAQMGCLRVDHPDIETFIHSKTREGQLTNFNISVLITDEFMEAVKGDKDFDLRFEGQTYRTVRARHLWDAILRNTWDWAEPGVLFIDRINAKNNLWYCERIAATNPCGEQPLPPYGACLLGSQNLVKYVKFDTQGNAYFDWQGYQHSIPIIIRAMDNVVDRATYPLKQQEYEAKNKRRMGIGITGLANTLTLLGMKYGSEESQDFLARVLALLRDTAYLSSIELAIEKGPFPLFDPKMFDSEFGQTLPSHIVEMGKKYGMRNSHLLSIAPTGTISLSADNVSSGIEPVFSYEYTRDILGPNGMEREVIQDYVYRNYGIKGESADSINVQQHVDMLCVASKYVDSACSKTCNVGDDVTWEEFKDVYMRAYDGGASGCTTFRASGRRAGILNASASEDTTEEKIKEADIFMDEGAACYIDPLTGIRSCE